MVWHNVTKTTPFQYLKTLLWYRGGWAGTLWIRSPSCRSAADSHAYSHERPERPTALHHRFANSAHQLSSSHADPEIKKKAEVTPKLKPGADIHSRNQLAQPANGRRGVQIRSPFSSLQREAVPSGSASSRRPEPPQGTAELVCTAAPCPGGSSIPAASQTPLPAGAARGQLKGEPAGVAPQLHTLRAPAVGWAAQGAQRGGSVSHWQCPTALSVGETAQCRQVSEWRAQRSFSCCAATSPTAASATPSHHKPRCV